MDDVIEHVHFQGKYNSPAVSSTFLVSRFILTVPRLHEFLQLMINSVCIICSKHRKMFLKYCSPSLTFMTNKKISYLY